MLFYAGTLKFIMVRSPQIVYTQKHHAERDVC